MASSLLCKDSRQVVYLQSNCLSNLILSATCLISLLLSSIHYFRHLRYQHKLFGFESVAANNEEDLNSSGFGYYTTTGSSLTTSLEIVGLLVDIIIGIALLLYGGATQDCLLAFAPVGFSVYLLLLLSGRSYSEKLGLQPQLVGLYAIQLLCIALVVSSIFIERSG